MVWLTTKMTVPQTTTGSIERTRILAILQQPKRLTIVQAPAGYGKTTLITQWVVHLKQPIIWLSLDATDNDPVRFWHYISRAIITVAPPHSQQQLDTIFTDALAPNMIIDLLLNAITDCEQPLHIVLDDYHVITHASINQTMKRFIDYLPSNARVYMTVREQVNLPVAKWRVKGWLTELTAEHLRFTYEELQQFYSKHATQPNLPQLLAVTEGWAAGVQLASLTDWTGDKRFMIDFLVQEILAELPENLQDFLIKTSILKPLTPTACMVLTGDSTSYEKLCEVERKGLFTTRLYSEQPTFRYHHLFAEALQLELHNRYSSVEIEKLYATALTLLDADGNFIGAIELALARKHYQQAEQWIIKHLVTLFTTGHTATFSRWVEQLRTANYLLDGEILLMYTIVLTIDYDIEKAIQVLREIDEHPEWHQRPSYVELGQILEMVRAFVYLAGGKDPRQTMVFVNRALTKVNTRSRWDAVSLVYNATEASLLTTSLGARGRLLWPEEVKPLQQLFGEEFMQDNSLTGFGYGVVAEVSYHRQEFEQALATAEAAILYAHHFNDAGLFVPMYCTKAKIYLAKQQFTEALGIVTYAMSTTTEPHWQDVLRTMRATCYIKQGDIRLAQKELAQATGLTKKDAKSSHSFWLITYADVLLAQHNAKEALVTILQVRDKAITERQVTTIIEAYLLEARCQQALDREDAAKTALIAALKIAKPYGYKTIFLQQESIITLLKKYALTHADNELRAYTQSLVTEVKLSILTPRELSLMTLLQQGASNGEIAEQLGLAEGTVRVYLSTIYSKLGVNSRAKAIALAFSQQEK